VRKDGKQAISTIIPSSMQKGGKEEERKDNKHSDKHTILYE
jgi:hypothetical protein